eukprot:409198-Prymnesium_polylepis.2
MATVAPRHAPLVQTGTCGSWSASEKAASVTSIAARDCEEVYYFATGVFRERDATYYLYGRWPMLSPEA